MEKPDATVRIGVDLGGTKIEIAALGNPESPALLRRRIPAPQGDYQATLEAITTLVAESERELGRSASVGLGIPGTVSPASGRVKNANSTWLIGEDLKGDLESRLRRPLRIANDADCFALAEARGGAGRGARSAFGVILGTGVGGGIVVDDRLVTGPNAISGEWGHNPLPWPRDEERPGPPCYCGLSGCIETWLSGPGFARDSGYADSEALRGGLAAKETQGLEALMRYQGRLARALATVINILDPEVIVLGGGLSRITALYEAVPRLWDTWVFSDRVDTKLLPPVRGDSAGVFGAAELWPLDEANEGLPR